MVVSEKIMKNKPIEKVIIFNFEYFEFSFDKITKRSGTNDNTRIYKGITNLL